jgi:hypothetical protein
MTTLRTSFTAVGVGGALLLQPGTTAEAKVSGTFVGRVEVQKETQLGSGAWDVVKTNITAADSFTVSNDSGVPCNYRYVCYAFTSGTIIAELTRNGAFDTTLGQVNQPTSGRVSCTVTRVGKFFSLDFTLNAARIPVTDAAASGSSGSLKLFDFVEGGIVPLGCRQDYTAFAEGAALTGAAGDAAFVMGLGSVAANAGDGVLTGTEVDFGEVTGTITLASGTGTGTQVSGAGLNSSAGLNGTGTAVDLFLNWSGTAATIDADSTIDVTGTVTVVGVFLGDD